MKKITSDMTDYYQNLLSKAQKLSSATNSGDILLQLKKQNFSLNSIFEYLSTELKALKAEVSSLLKLASRTKLKL